MGGSLRAGSLLPVGVDDVVEPHGGRFDDPFVVVLGVHVGLLVVSGPVEPDVGDRNVGQGYVGIEQSRGVCAFGVQVTLELLLLGRSGALDPAESAGGFDVDDLPGRVDQVGVSAEDVGALVADEGDVDARLVGCTRARLR